MLSIAEIFEEMRITLRDPREGARRVLAFPIPDGAVWSLFVLSIVLSTLAAELNSLLNPPAPDQPVVYVAPILLAVTLGTVNAVMAAALAAIGRGFGGAGHLRPALILMAWQQLIWCAALVVISVIGLIAPGFGSILTLVFGLFLIWMLICFTRELHGFESTGVSVVVMVMASVAAGVVMIALLGVFAVTHTGVALE